MIQAMSGAISATYSFVVTFMILKVMCAVNVLPLLEGHREQMTAIDSMQHGEVGYSHPALDGADLTAGKLDHVDGANLTDSDTTSEVESSAIPSARSAREIR